MDAHEFKDNAAGKKSDGPVLNDEVFSASVESSLDDGYNFCEVML